MQHDRGGDDGRPSRSRSMRGPSATPPPARARAPGDLPGCEAALGPDGEPDRPGSRPAQAGPDRGQASGPDRAPEPRHAGRDVAAARRAESTAGTTAPPALLAGLDGDAAPALEPRGRRPAASERSSGHERIAATPTSVAFWMTQSMRLRPAQRLEQAHASSAARPRVEHPARPAAPRRRPARRRSTTQRPIPRPRRRTRAGVSPAAQAQHAPHVVRFLGASEIVALRAPRRAPGDRHATARGIIRPPPGHGEAPTTRQLRIVATPEPRDVERADDPRRIGLEEARADEQHASGATSAEHPARRCRGACARDVGHDAVPGPAEPVARGRLLHHDSIRQTRSPARTSRGNRDRFGVAIERAAPRAHRSARPRGPGSPVPQPRSSQRRSRLDTSVSSASTHSRVVGCSPVPNARPGTSRSAIRPGGGVRSPRPRGSTMKRPAEREWGQTRLVALDPAPVGDRLDAESSGQGARAPASASTRSSGSRDRVRGGRTRRSSRRPAAPGSTCAPEALARKQAEDRRPRARPARRRRSRGRAAATSINRRCP